MTTTPEVKDKAAEAVGAGAADQDEATNGTGPDAPPPPSNEPPPAKTDDTASETPADDKPAEGEGEAPPEDKPLDIDAWGTTGDPVGDSVLTLLQNSGLDPDGAKALLYDAMQAGDVTQIDAKALAEKVGKDKATLILAGAENYLTRQKAQAQTIAKEVHGAVGGEENWTAIRTWAVENVPDADMADIRDMIDAGGLKARFAATELARRYNADSKNSSIDVGTQEVIPDSKAAPTVRVLNKGDYVKEIAAAYDRGASEAEIAEINAARQRGRERGI